MDKDKVTIINLFNTRVKGKKFDPKGFNVAHDGKEGHWIEKLMGIKPNADNRPDILGYEMKKNSKKISFGDWSASEALWKVKTPDPTIPKLDRDTEFLAYFGQPNKLKKNRLSWSGKPIPKIDTYNTFGQILKVESNGDIVIYYSFNKDMRPNKGSLMPSNLKVNNLIVARFSKEKMQKHVEPKFNNKGFFICFKDKSGTYDSIGFGGPFNYKAWLNTVKSGIVFYDCGMYSGNSREYSQWRANNRYWLSLIKEKY